MQDHHPCDCCFGWLTWVSRVRFKLTCTVKYFMLMGLRSDCHNVSLRCRKQVIFSEHWVSTCTWFDVHHMGDGLCHPLNITFKKRSSSIPVIWGLHWSLDDAGVCCASAMIPKLHSCTPRNPGHYLFFASIKSPWARADCSVLLCRQLDWHGLFRHGLEI